MSHTEGRNSPSAPLARLSDDADWDQVFRRAISRRSMLGVMGALGVGASLSELLAACVNGTSGTVSISGDRLTWGYAASSQPLDTRSNDPLTESIYANALEGLIRIDQNGEVAPSLAESWSQPDALTYVYQVRSGVKFWDGTPMTLDDIIFSINIHIDPAWASGRARAFESVDSVKATGPSEITIKLKSPVPWFKYAPYQARVSPASFLQKHMKDLGTPGVLNLGSGPYILKAYIPDESVTLVRNDNWWGTPKPYFKTVVINFITDPATRLLSMRSGQINGANDILFAQISQWKQVSGEKIYSAPGARWAYFSFNVKKAPWSDIHVRRAFAHCIDKAGVVAAVLQGHGSVSTAISSRATWSALVPRSQVDTIFSQFGKNQNLDIQAAKAELALSTVPNGFTADVRFPDARAELGQAALNLAQNLKQLNITLNVAEVTEAQWVQELVGTPKDNLGLMVVRISDDWPDPQQYMFNQMASSQAVIGSLNTANYMNPNVDSLFQQAAATTDAQKRASLLSQVLKYQDDDLPYLPFWEQDIVAGSSGHVTWPDYNTWYNQTAWITSVKSP
jgi:peptide/nickel transport system substrate-binding protein